jgi:hypothetical protein
MPNPSDLSHEWMIGTTNFRLAPREMSGKIAHTVEPVPFLSTQISSTAELSYSDIDRRREVAFAQDDFTGGLSDNLKFNLERQRKFRYSKGADTSVPGVGILPGPKINTIGSAVADQPTGPVLQRSTGMLYVAAGAKLYRVADSTTTPALDSTFAATITSLFEWGGYLVVGLGDSSNFMYRANDVASAPTSGATAFTSGGVAGRYFTAINDTLYRAVRPKSLSIAQAVTGPWADYDVGDSSFNITSVGPLDQVIIVGKEDGPYGFDQDAVAQPIAPELRLQAEAQVCKAAIEFNRDYYVSSRLGIVRIRPGEGLKNVGLDLLADPALPANDSRPAAFATDGRFLYAIVAPGPSTTGLYIWKRDYNDAWHNYLWRSDLGEAATMLYATGKLGSTTVNAVIFAYKSGSNWQLAYARFPATIDPTKDSAYTFETAVASKVRTLDYMASYPTIKKYSDRLKHVVDSATSARATTYTAYLDDTATTVTLGTYQKSPYEEKVLGSPLEYHRASLELSITSESATPPKVRAFHLSAAYLARVVNRHTCQFIATSNTPFMSGGRGRDEWSDAIDKLRELQASKAAVTVRDEDKRKFTAYVEDVTVWNAQERQTPEASPMKIATVTLTEIGPNET